MSLPRLTAQLSLRTADDSATGVARAPMRGLVPAAPFCIRAQWHDGYGDAVGRAGYSEARHVQDIPVAREEAVARARRANAGFGEQLGYTVRTTVIDRDRDPGEYQTCVNLARQANIFTII